MGIGIWLTIDVDAGGDEPLSFEVWSGSITKNLGRMWVTAGVYDALYMSAGKQAGELLDALDRGLAHMSEHPEIYEPLNPSNGWGDYPGALEFLADFTAACHKAPNAIVGVSK